MTAAQIAIWNNGKESVRGNNLLSPFVIEMGLSSSIIEADIQKVSRDVIGLELDKSKIDEGQLGVDWTILEQHDGAVLQLIYFGGPLRRITASAIVEKQDKIRSMDHVRKGKRWKILPGLMAVSLISMFLYTLRTSGPDKPIYVHLAAVLNLLQVVGLILLFFYWVTPSPSPPFGWGASP